MAAAGKGLHPPLAPLIGEAPAAQGEPRGGGGGAGSRHKGACVARAPPTRLPLDYPASAGVCRGLNRERAEAESHGGHLAAALPLAVPACAPAPACAAPAVTTHLPSPAVTSLLRPARGARGCHGALPPKPAPHRGGSGGTPPPTSLQLPATPSRTCSFSRPPGQPPASGELRPAHPATASPRCPPHSGEMEGDSLVPP